MKNNEIILIIKYMIENQCTIREASKEFKVAKSTLHWKIHQNLQYLDEDDFESIINLLETNFKEKASRGGSRFKELYEGKKRVEYVKRWKKNDK